ncbi:MAG: 63, gp63 [Acidimicrobiales bacterium]|nr:63, gp63 [Acidimicrobiales bacterium]
MSWNRRDDGCNDHPKIRALGCAEADLLWQKAGVGCSKSGTGGLVSPADLELYNFLAYNRTTAKARKAVEANVREGTWHDHETIARCERCQEYLEKSIGVEVLLRGWYLFHDWTDCNKSRIAEDDDVKKFKEQRARQLKDMPTLKMAVFVTRDREYCRYCAVRTTHVRGDTKSNSRRVPDHVDPMGPNADWNLATACGRCNGRKRDRTPAEANMPLLAPPVDGRPPEPYPDGYVAIDANDPGPAPSDTGLKVHENRSRTEAAALENQGRAEDAPTSDHGPLQGPASRDARDGPGMDGPRSGLGRASVGSGPAGPGLAGLVRAGSGVVGLGPVGQGAGRAPAVSPSSTTEPNVAHPTQHKAGSPPPNLEGP